MIGGKCDPIYEIPSRERAARSDCQRLFRNPRSTEALQVFCSRPSTVRQSPCRYERAHHLFASFVLAELAVCGF